MRAVQPGTRSEERTGARGRAAGKSRRSGGRPTVMRTSCYSKTMIPSLAEITFTRRIKLRITPSFVSSFRNSGGGTGVTCVGRVALNKNYAAKPKRSFLPSLQRCASPCVLHFVECVLEILPGWWADTVATYCPSRPSQLTKKT